MLEPKSTPAPLPAHGRKRSPRWRVDIPESVALLGIRCLMATLGSVWVLWHLAPVSPHWLTFCRDVPLWPMIVALPVVLWGAARDNRPRVRRARLLLAATLSAGSGWNIAPPFQRISWGRPVVRVLLWNIGGATQGPEPLIAVVRRIQPDVIVFTEAHAYSPFALGRLDLQRLALPGWSTVWENGYFVASRWPCRPTLRSTLGIPVPEDPSRDRRILITQVDSPWGPFEVASAHFQRPLRHQWSRRPWRSLRGMEELDRLRRLQVSQLVAAGRGVTAPLLLAGDFNLTPASRPYAGLRKAFRDTFAESGWGHGATYPAACPLIRIDYLLHNRGWSSLSCRVVRGEGSDHLPILAELALR